MELQDRLEEVGTEAYTAANSSDSPLNAHNILTTLYIIVKYYGKCSMKLPHFSADFLSYPTEGITVILLWNSERLLRENHKWLQQC